MVTNKQESMRKFTKLVAERCYKLQVEVKVDYYLAEGFKIICGLCHKENKQTPLIKYNGAVFKKYESEEWSWYLIIHEVSHLFKKGAGHSKEYWSEVANNFQKTMDLREEYFKETGLDGDAYIDFDYEEYEDEEPIEPAEDDTADYEHLDQQDVYFDIYRFPREID